jgi:hypothetical protein
MNNSRLIERNITSLEYLAEYTSGITFPRGMCSDGTHLYLLNGGWSLDKYLIGNSITELSLVSSESSWIEYGTFQFPSGICTDGTYLYVADNSTPCSVIKFQCLDLSFVSFTTSIVGYTYDSDLEDFYSGQFLSPTGIATDGVYVFVVSSYGTYGAWIHVFQCSNLSWIATSEFPLYEATSMAISGIDVLDGHVYISVHEPIFG